MFCVGGRDLGIEVDCTARKSETLGVKLYTLNP